MTLDLPRRYAKSTVLRIFGVLVATELDPLIPNLTPSGSPQDMLQHVVLPNLVTKQRVVTHMDVRSTCCFGPKGGHLMGITGVVEKESFFCTTVTGSTRTLLTAWSDAGRLAGIDAWSSWRLNTIQPLSVSWALVPSWLRPRQRPAAEIERPSNKQQRAMFHVVERPVVISCFTLALEPVLAGFKRSTEAGVPHTHSTS